MKRLLTPNGPDGNGPAEPPTTPPAPASPPSPPAAAVVIAAGDERLKALAEELADEKRSHATTANEKKQREVRIAELEDERRTIKARLDEIEDSLKAKPLSKPATKKSPGLRAWLTGDGWDEEAN